MINKLLIGLVALVMFFSAAVVFAEGEAAVGKFTLIFLGTKNYQDLEVVKNNVKKISQMTDFYETLASQNHVRFQGNFAGSEDSLVQDIAGLAQDRFDVKTRNDTNDGLVITLRKIK